MRFIKRETLANKCAGNVMPTIRVYKLHDIQLHSPLSSSSSSTKPPRPTSPRLVSRMHSLTPSIIIQVTPFGLICLFWMHIKCGYHKVNIWIAAFEGCLKRRERNYRIFELVTIWGAVHNSCPIEWISFSLSARLTCDKVTSSSVASL